MKQDICVQKPCLKVTPFPGPQWDPVDQPYGEHKQVKYPPEPSGTVQHLWAVFISPRWTLKVRGNSEEDSAAVHGVRFLCYTVLKPWLPWNWIIVFLIIDVVKPQFRPQSVPGSLEKME